MAYTFTEASSSNQNEPEFIDVDAARQQQQQQYSQQQQQQQQQQQSQQQQPSSDGRMPQYDAYMAQFESMTIEQMVEKLSQDVPQSALGTEARAFLDNFVRRLFAERAARESADQTAQAAASAAQQAQQAANYYQNIFQQQQAAHQAAGQGNGQPNSGQTPPQTQPHMSNQQPNQQGMNQQNQNVNQDANVGGASKLGAALSKGLKPPQFDGTKVIDWLFKVHQYLEAIDDQASEIAKLKFVANLLTGKALTWWRHKRQHEGTTYTQLQTFCDDIYRQFVDHDHVNKLRDQLDSLTQGKSSVQKYITKFKELQIELGPYALDDAQALYRFKKGLSPQLRLFTQIAQPTNFSAACEVAAQNESALSGSMGAQPSTRTNGPQPMDLGTFTASANYTQANSQRRGNPNNNKNKGKSTFYSNTPRPSSSGDWKKNATCHYCGKRGHIKPDCNQLRRDNNPTTVKGGAYGKPAATKGKLSLATEVAELRAELAALRAQSSKN